MTRIITFVTLFFATLAAQSTTVVTASSKYVRQNINVNVATVTELVTQSMIDIVYYDSKTQKVELYAPDNLTKYITIEHSGNTLSVKFNQSITIKGVSTIKLIVSSPNVTSFRTNSSGDIKLMTPLQRTGEVKCFTNSSGDIKGSTINAASIKLITNSSGDISFTNLKCTSLNASANSSGDIKCSESIHAPTVSLSSNSSGDIYGGNIVSENFAASSNSSGDITTKSVNSTTLTLTSSSSGDLKISGILANSVRATSGSSGNIILTGYCNDATLSASSSSDIIASDLKAKSVTARTGSSSSSITCYATDRMEIHKARNSSIRNMCSGFITSVLHED